MRLAFIFPGQGSQYVGMGRALHEGLPAAREIFDLASQIAGRNIARLCFEGPADLLTRTDNLQVALTAVDLAHLAGLRAQGLEPAACAGHSLGEYAALVAAGAMAAQDALALVNLRGRLMQREAERHPGSMAAVIGLSLEAVARLCEEAGGQVVVANHNSPEQVVISGEAQALGRAVGLAKAAGAKAVPLAVSGAWHSPLIAGAEAELAAAIRAVPFSAPRCPVVSNVTGTPERDPERLRENLCRQLCSPVRWVDSLRSLEGLASLFIEVGPKKVLTGLCKKSLPAAVAVSAEDPEGLQTAIDAIN